MYITTNNNTAEQAANPVECPVICEQRLYAYINLLGVSFGIICLAIHLVKKKYFRHPRSRKKKIIQRSLTVAFWIFLALFLLYFLKIEYHDVNGGCAVRGILLNGGLLPDFLYPIYGTR